MKTPATDKIRNVAVIGHSGSGKTSIVEALLLRAGVLARPGSVEDGTTVCDHEPEEAKRQMSLGLALAPFEWKASDGATYKVNLIDTPGYGDFAGDVDTALAVADLAVLVVSAVDGVEVGTETAWRKCAERNVPRLVFVSKDDKQRADFHRVLEQLRSTFGTGFVPLELPLGEEEALHGVADVLTGRGFEYDGDGTHHAAELPDDVAEEERRLHDELVEEIVSGDDEQLERYLSGDVPTASRARAHARPRGARLHRVPRPGRLGIQRRRHRPSRRLHLRAGPFTRRSSDEGGGRPERGARRGRRRRRPGGQAPGIRVQDRRRPVRRAGVGVQGAVRPDPTGRSPPQHGHRYRRAPARVVPPARQGAHARRHRRCR
ncbi:MAG: GTP-binding protein [Ilumatobacteraceae bacterium]